MNLIDHLDTFSIFILSFTSFVSGVCLLYIKGPQDATLQHYYMARRILTFAYFVTAFLKLAELLDFTNIQIEKYACVFSLIISSFQVTLFAFAIITLITPRYLSRKRIYIHLLPVSAFSLLLLAAYTTKAQSIYLSIFYLFLLFFLCQLFFYTHLFYQQYRRYKEQLDNYYSEQKQNQLRWIKTAFFSALCCGIFAFLHNLFPHIFSFYLTLLIALFYFYFGLRYINYAFIFDTIKPVLTSTAPVESGNNKTYTKADLDQVLALWLEKKEYLNKTLSIEEVARALQTNRTYLSKYINAEKQVNFKTWINDLRIEEARCLIRQYPEKTIGEIGLLVGFSEKSNFSRQFQKSTGVTPYHYRKSLS